MVNNSFKVRYKSLPIAISKSTNSNTETHNHPEFEILKILKGSGSVWGGGEEYKVSEGDLIFVNPMQVHLSSYDKNNAYAHKCVCFNLSLIGDELLRSNLRKETALVTPLISVNSPYNAIFSDYFELLYSSCENEREVFSMEAPCYITLIFSTLIKGGYVNVNAVTKNDAEFEKTVVSYISEHLFENITSLKASKELNFNQSYFCRNFKKCFGMSFSNYVNLERVSYSRRLLEEGKSITQVALQVGFPSATAYTKFFKKKYGLLPSEYKK